MKKFRLPTLFPRKKKKLRAGIRRASASGADFYDISEPNMKLSRALLIVLLLHVVAVAGIIAFNAIKSRQGNLAVATPSTISKPQPSVAETKVAKNVPVLRKTAPQIDPPKFYVVVKSDTLASVAKKFKVPPDELLAANHIDDARKLKVGQKLLIPAKSKTKKASE